MIQAFDVLLQIPVTADVAAKNRIDEPFRYDDCDLVREIYQNYLIREYEMFHSAHNRAQGRELIITNIPENHFHWR